MQPPTGNYSPALIVVSTCGKGELPAAEQAKLTRIVQQVHKDGQKIRFWAAPDNPAAWKVLHQAGVDFINTDRLEALAKFLRAKGSE